jgi:hypothetical protein
LPLGDEFVEVVGLGRGELAHREVVEDEDVGPDEFADPFLPGAVRVAAGEVGEDATGLGEADVGALPILRAIQRKLARTVSVCYGKRPDA